MRVLFTNKVHNELKYKGYTHIQQRGIENKPEELKNKDQDQEYDYILIPLKQIDFSLEDAHRVLEINSSDVYDMIDVEFGINFWVELSE